MQIDEQIDEELLDYILEGEWTLLTYGNHKNLYARGLICNDGSRVVVLSEIEQEINKNGKEEDVITLKGFITFEDFAKFYQDILIQWAGVIH